MRLVAREPLPAESRLLLPVLRGLLRLRWARQMSPAALEVRWHQKRIDVAFLDRESDFVAIELKVAKWKRAIDQAYVNRWVCDASWVALWHESVSNETYRYARGAQVGLLAVTANTVYPLIRPGEAPRSGTSTGLREEIRDAGSCVRDLLTHARREAGALA